MKSTDRLDNIELAGGLTSNLMPKSMGLALMDLISGWKDGYDMLTIVLLPKDRLFMYKLDGSIKIDGTSAKHETSGLYSAVLPPTQFFSADITGKGYSIPKKNKYYRAACKRYC